MVLNDGEENSCHCCQDQRLKCSLVFFLHQKFWQEQRKRQTWLEWVGGMVVVNRGLKGSVSLMIGVRVWYGMCQQLRFLSGTKRGAPSSRVLTYQKRSCFLTTMPMMKSTILSLLTIASAEEGFCNIRECGCPPYREPWCVLFVFVLVCSECSAGLF